MLGSVKYNAKTKTWYVRWWDKSSKKDVKIYHYKGIKIRDQRLAERLLQDMRSDYEDGTFYIEKYKQQSFSDIIPFLDHWIDTVDGLAPATYKGYKSYLKNHIKPFFQKHNRISLPDIQIDVLRQLRKELEGKGLSPKMQWNVIFCLHAILDAAWLARRIPNMPPFPKKKEYKIINKPIQWLPEVRQLNVISHIPKKHQPIFYWLKYHLRRPGEACALHKEDYRDGVFEIHRGISARVLQEKTKTGEIHNTPCHPDFEPHLEVEVEKQKKMGIISPFFFMNPGARNKEKMYKSETLNRLWNKACAEVGEDLPLYVGTKHSSCSQHINEKGLSESELQIITDHARIESVRNYAKTEVKRKRELMIKNIFQIDSKKKTSN